jgi:hypothetical protein
VAFTGSTPPGRATQSCEPARVGRGAEALIKYDFTKAFQHAAEAISMSDRKRIDLAWQQLHLLQLLYRDLMASAFNLEKPNPKRTEIFQCLFLSLKRIVECVFDGRGAEQSILDRMSTFVLVAWAKIASQLGDEAISVVKPYAETALRSPIHHIADSLWRFQGHSLAGAGDLDSACCGVEAFAFVSALNISLDLRLAELAKVRADELQNLWANADYIPHFLLRDWRGLSYGLKARRMHDLAAC